MTRLYAKIGQWLSRTSWGRPLVAHIQSHPKVYLNLEAILFALSIALIIRAVALQSYVIPTGSMKNTLLEGDRIFVEKVTKYWDEPEIGDIIVFKVPEEIPNFDPKKQIYVKRVVALSGDFVQITPQGALLVNGKELNGRKIFRENQYFRDMTRNGVFVSAQVPEGEIFVMGDNSQQSFDSRYWGRPEIGRPVVGVPEENVIGKAIFRFWPLNRLGLIQDDPIRPRPKPLEHQTADEVNEATSEESRHAGQPAAAAQAR